MLFDLFGTVWIKRCESLVRREEIEGVRLAVIIAFVTSSLAECASISLQYGHRPSATQGLKSALGRVFTKLI